MDWRIEVVTIPVTDVDAARDFYRDKLGFNVDIDMEVGDGVKLTQLTPRGSACSIHLGKQTTQMQPGSLDGLFLVVNDLRKARVELVERGVEVGDFMVFEEGNYRPASEDDNLDYTGCVFLEDPDGNRWTVQQIPARIEHDA